MMSDHHGTLTISKTRKKKRRIVVGLNSHNGSREMLQRLLTLVVSPGDNVLAVHVRELADNFDPNSFHMQEDICKSKQVEFQVKLRTGGAFITVLMQEVKLQVASILVLGCNRSRPKESFVVSCLQELPSTCCLMVMNNGGQILVQQTGQYQCSSMSRSPRNSLSYLLFHNSCTNHSPRSPKILPLLYPLRSLPTNVVSKPYKVKNTTQCFNAKTLKQFQQFAKGPRRQFTPRELEYATENFSPQMVIGEGNQSTVYRGNLKDEQAVAVKVMKITKFSGDELVQEVDMLSELDHEHIVRLIGYCYSKDMHAVVYNLLSGSLMHNLKYLGWKERINVAVGVAKALQYLHHFRSPAIIHRDVKSSNILLSHHFIPQLSDFGMATVKHRQQKSLATKEQIHVVGTFGYLAPEYVMYGNVNEKIDVYSYGVVLLELITGRTAIQKDADFKQGSLVLWAKSLISCGQYQKLIDPNISEDYNKEEMQRMLTAAQLCLRQLSSRRPTMTKIVKLLEEPEYWAKVRREGEEHINGRFTQESISEGYDDQGLLSFHRD